MPQPPKVFVSHASEDKDRFVLEFAKRLRENGINAWLDKWEMSPGDSLIDKIFEEGIKNASAVIVVLSSISIEKPWIREELNAAFIQRVNRVCKLIPIIIDGIDDSSVPAALKTTYWQRIDNISSYESSFENIVAAFYGIKDKPPIGKQPSYLEKLDVSIGDLNNVDSFVLRCSCDELLRAGNPFIDPKEVFLNNDKQRIPITELIESLEVLDRKNYIELNRTLGEEISLYRVTLIGFDVYAKSAFPDYNEKKKSVISVLVNEKIDNSEAICNRLQENAVIINHFLDLLQSNGYIKQSKFINGLSRIYQVSPELKRCLSQGWSKKVSYLKYGR